MKKILLTQDEFTIVDDENYEWLNQFKWCAHWCKNTKSFYAVSRIKDKNGKIREISMAREILGLKHGDKRQADHIDHNTLDNRELNLRIVTNNQNQWNQKNPRGYSRNKNKQKYQAQIKLNGKTIYLGLFFTAEEAHGVYLNAKEKYHNIYI